MNIFSFLDVQPFVHATSTCHSYHSSSSLTPFWQRFYNNLTKVDDINGKKTFYFEHRKPSYNKNFRPRLQTTTPKKLFLLKSQQATSSETIPINIDFGSYSFKAGFCADELPKCVVPVCGTSEKGLLRRPFIDRQIANLDDVSEMWEYTNIDCLQVLPSESITLVQHNALDSKHKEKITEIAFEEFGVSAWHMAPNSCMIVYASGSTIGVSVDIGYESLSITLVSGGVVDSPNAIQVPIGGNHVTNRLKQLAKQRYPNIDEVLEDDCFEYIKKNMCYVHTEPNQIPREIKENTFEGYQFDEELYEAAEVLFDPSIVGVGEKRLVNLILDLINSSTLPKRDLCNNILVCGGGSMLAGFTERLQNEMNMISSDKCRIQSASSIYFTNGTGDSLAWLGGSIIASLGYCWNPFWVNRTDYDERYSSD